MLWNSSSTLHYSCNSPKNHFFIKDGWFQNPQGLTVWSNLSFNLIPVILILLTLYMHKGNHMYDCNFIMLFLVLLQKQTFLHQSTHQPIYITTSNILCSPNAIVWRNQSPLSRYFVISLIVITTVTLPVTCHIGLREATFSHENMPVSIRKKYYKTWGALGSDKELA